MEKIDESTQKQILDLERQRWSNELELMRIRARVADKIEDARMKEEVKIHAEKCVKAIDEIDAMLKEFDAPNA